MSTSAQQHSDDRWRQTCSLPITTFSALYRVSHVMRYINLRYLLTYFTKFEVHVAFHIPVRKLSQSTLQSVWLCCRYKWKIPFVYQVQGEHERRTQWMDMTSGMLCRVYTRTHVARIHDYMYPGRATCIRRIHICRRIHVAGYKLLVRYTCRLYLGDIITIHLCHGRLVPLQKQTGDKMATVLSRYKIHVDGDK